MQVILRSGNKTPEAGGVACLLSIERFETDQKNVWLRHRAPTLNWMMRGLLGAVPHGEPHDRSPFKAI